MRGREGGREGEREREREREREKEGGREGGREREGERERGREEREREGESYNAVVDKLLRAELKTNKDTGKPGNLEQICQYLFVKLCLNLIFSAQYR